MSKVPGSREAFLVQILNTQNATWQGTVTWTDGKRTQSFRSALELIKLIDSALEEQAQEEALSET
jgi:hypothetical protein